MRREISYSELDAAVGLSAEENLFVIRLQANEDAAYDELVRIYHASIYHVAVRMLDDPGEAADTTQDIFVKVFRNIARFKGEAALKTWIYRIAFSEILNRLRWFRRRYRYSTVSLDDTDSEGKRSDSGAGWASHTGCDSGIEGTGECDTGGDLETVEPAPFDHRPPGYRRLLLRGDRRNPGYFDRDGEVAPGSGARRPEEVPDAVPVGETHRMRSAWDWQMRS